MIKYKPPYRILLTTLDGEDYTTKTMNSRDKKLIMMIVGFMMSMFGAMALAHKAFFPTIHQITEMSFYEFYGSYLQEILGLTGVMIGLCLMVIGVSIPSIQKVY